MSFVVFDIETTGLYSDHCDILQFAYILFDANNIAVRAENLYFYQKGMHWDQEVSFKSHKLSTQFLSQFEDEYEQNVLKMYAVLNRQNVCGYNSNSFDCPFVKNWLVRRGLTDFEFGIRQDAMLALKPLYRGPRISLIKLSEQQGLTPTLINQAADVFFGEDANRSAHNAIYDTTATALLTLQGINKGYISFNPTSVELTDEHFNFVSEEEQKVLHPESFIATLGDSEVLVTPDTENFATTDDIDLKSPDIWNCPAKFTETANDTYTATAGGCDIEVTKEDAGYLVVIGSPYVTVSSKTTTILNLLKSLFKE